MFIQLIFSTYAFASTKPHFIADQCVAIYQAEPVATRRTKINACAQTNAECELKPNASAKVLCACDEENLPGSREQEACYLGALKVIQNDKKMKTAEFIAQKLPRCKRAGKREATSPDDPDETEEHVKCLKNAFFETDLAIQSLENGKNLQDKRKDQTVEQDMRNQELQRGDSYYHPFQ